MKITILSSTLLKSLSSAIVIIRETAVVPAVANFLIEIDNSMLKITATDLSNTIEESISIESAESARILIPARPFYEIIKALLNQNIDLIINKTSIEIISLSGKHILALESDTTFPTVKIDMISKSLCLEAELLSKGIDNTALTMGKDSMMETTEGLYIHTVNKKLRLVTTSGNSISVFTIEKEIDLPVSLFLQSRSVGYLKSFLVNKSDVAIKYSTNGVFFEAGNSIFSCLTKVVKFANYLGVDKHTFQIIALLDKNLLVSALKRVTVLAPDQLDATLLDFTDTLRLSYQDDQLSKQATEIIPVVSVDESFSIGTNGRKLTQFISLMETHTVRMSFTNSEGLFMIEDAEKNEEYTTRIYSMPIKIHNQ